MAEAAALGGPHEAAVRQHHQRLLGDVDPGRRLFAQHQGARARRGIEADEVERRLRTVEQRGAEAAVAPPEDAGQVALLAGVEVHPDRRARVGGAGEGIAVVLIGARGRVVAQVRNAIDGDVRLIHLGEGDLPAVRRPPEALAPVQLLLRDVLGQAVRRAGAARAKRKLPGAGAAAVRGHDVELGIAHEGDLAAIRGERGGEDGRRVCSLHDEPQGRARPIQHVEVIADRDEQALGALGAAVAREAGGERALALASQLFGG